jgi:D-alanyl-D-alanine carboxypeptidase (penicillin-binding protein 5/6)
MALLSCEACRHPDLLHYTSIFEMRIRGGETWLVNRNRMVDFYQGCDGLKTGWTVKAGYSVSVTAKRGGTRYVAVVMGAEQPTDRFADTIKMLNWGFSTFNCLAVAEKGHSYGAVPVDLGVYREIEAVAPRDQGVLLKKGEEGDVTRDVVLSRILKAPVRRGDPVGSIVVSRAGTELGRYTLVSDRDVGRISFLGLWWRLYSRILGAG